MSQVKEVKVTHRPHNHWATIKSRLAILKLLWGKKKVDIYTLIFDKNCLQAPTNAYNKILGTSKYPYPRWGSSRLAWINNGDGTISVGVMDENRKGIVFYKRAIVSPEEAATVMFKKKYWLQANTSYIGGDDPANVEVTYTLR